MTTSRIVVYTLIGVAVTPIAVIAALASAGAGHGHYEFARVLFPYTMLLTPLANNTIAPLLIVLAFVQFPLYGALIGLANRKSREGLVMLILALAHLVAAALCFSGLLPNFS